MLPDNFLEAFSQYHSPDKGFYLPTDNRIFSLHYDNPEACVCSVSIVSTLPCRSDSVHRPVRDRQILNPDQHTVKTSHDTLYPFSAVCSQFTHVIMDLVVIV